MSEIAEVTLLKAMDGLSMRMLAHAENIANASTPAYRPVRVDFEAALLTASKDGADAVRAIVPQMLRAGTQAGGVRLDLELAGATATAGRYTALAELLDRQLQLDRLAMTGGRNA